MGGLRAEVCPRGSKIRASKSAQRRPAGALDMRIHCAICVMSRANCQSLAHLHLSVAARAPT
jgi:hypothetical protein